jgi:hypothetical protein
MSLEFLGGQPAFPMIALAMTVGAVLTNARFQGWWRYTLIAAHVIGLSAMTVLYPWQGNLKEVPRSVMLAWTFVPYFLAHLGWWTTDLMRSRRAGRGRTVG